MANRAYLCCSNADLTYPSVRYRRYRPEVHTLAGARDRVPLLWLALFEPGDLRSEVLPGDDGEDVDTLAPLARRADALARLDGAVARLERAYPRIGPLGAHAEPFRRMLKSARGTFVTIELEEIAWLSRSQSVFDKRLRKALDYIAGGEAARISRTLTAASGVDPKRRLVPPKELFARSRPTKADLFACMSVVGMSHIREVPWEEAPERPAPKPRAPKLHHQLHEALAAGDEPLARELLARGANPNVATLRGLTMEYVIGGNVSLDMGRALVAAGFDLTKRCQGYTALQRAIGFDGVDAVRGQLEIGASPTHEDGFRRAPLALAACRGALKCVDFFLGLGADAKAIKAAIRHAERGLAKPAVPLEPRESRQMRAAIARLQAALEQRLDG